MTRNGLGAQKDPQESCGQNPEQHVYGCVLEQIPGLLNDLNYNIHFKKFPYCALFIDMLKPHPEKVCHMIIIQGVIEHLSVPPAFYKGKIF